MFNSNLCMQTLFYYMRYTYLNKRFKIVLKKKYFNLTALSFFRTTFKTAVTGRLTSNFLVKSANDLKQFFT